MSNRNNATTLTNITNNATNTLIADDEACKIIVATAERKYRGAERPAQQTRTIELKTITKFRWRECESNSSGKRAKIMQEGIWWQKHIRPAK